MTNTPQNPGQFTPGFTPGFSPGFSAGFSPQPFGTVVPEEPGPKMRRTSVFCEADSTTGNRFVIDTEGPLARISDWALIGGGVLMAIGAGLILGGVFWKKTPAPAV